MKSVPVNTRLPSSIKEAVEHVENKGTSIACIRPILLHVVLVFSPGAVVSLLEHVSKAPDDHDADEERGPCGFGSGCSADALDVKPIAKDVSADDLHDVVDNTIQSSCANVEVGSVNLGEVICVEPVGCQEHGEKKNNVRVREEGLP